MSDATHPEEWRPIPGYERTYEVSSLGRVKSLSRTTTRGGLRKLHVSGTGYWAVSLIQGGRSRTWPVHQLVALAFIGEPPEGLEIRHLNGDSLDSRAVNLEYGTARENRLDTIRHGRHRNVNKTHCPRGHEYTHENTYVLPSRPTARYCRACHNLTSNDAARRRRTLARR